MAGELLSTDVGFAENDVETADDGEAGAEGAPGSGAGDGVEVDGKTNGEEVANGGVGAFVEVDCESLVESPAIQEGMNVERTTPHSASPPDVRNC